MHTFLNVAILNYMACMHYISIKYSCACLRQTHRTVSLASDRAKKASLQSFANGVEYVLLWKEAEFIIVRPRGG